MQVHNQVSDGPASHVQLHDRRTANGIVLLTGLDDQSCMRVLEYLGNEQCAVVRDLESLELMHGHILVSFSHSMIVPASVLKRYEGNAYNIHAASPAYPGRDPHHWAAYDGVTTYGATCHVMTEKVDEGAIVDVEWVNTSLDDSPEQLLARANEAAFELLKRIGPKLQRGELLKPINVQWSGIKRSRADLMLKCTIDPNIAREEFDRVYRAFDGGSYNNLVVNIHGHTFRIDKASQ